MRRTSAALALLISSIACQSPAPAPPVRPVGSPAFPNPLVVQQISAITLQYGASEYNAGNSGTSLNINWLSNQDQRGFEFSMKRWIACAFALLFSLFASSADASIAIVQTAPIYQNGSLQTGSVTFSSAVTAGHAILAMWGETENAGGPPYAPSATVSDGTDTYSQIRNDGSGSAFSTQMLVQAWGANSITASTAVTVSVNAGTGFVVNWIIATEVSGQNTTTLVDNVGATANNASAPLTTLSVTFSTVATSTIVLGIAQTSGSFATSWTQGSGYSILAQSSSGAPLGVFYQLESSAGSVSPNFSLNPLDFAILSAFSIKGASGAAPASPAIFFGSSN